MIFLIFGIDAGRCPQGLFDAYIAVIQKVEGDITPIAVCTSSGLSYWSVCQVWSSPAIKGVSSVGAWYATSLDICCSGDLHICPLDVVESCDTVDYDILDCALGKLGLPAWFRKAFLSSRRKVRLRFKFAAGFGVAWTRDGTHGILVGILVLLGLALQLNDLKMLRSSCCCCRPLREVPTHAGDEMCQNTACCASWQCGCRYLCVSRTFWPKKLLMTNTPALFNLLASLWISGPACPVILGRFRQLRWYLEYKPEKEFRIYRLLDYVYLLVESVTELVSVQEERSAGFVVSGILS